VFVDVTWVRMTSLVAEKWREDGVRMSAMRNDVVGFVATWLSPSAAAADAASGEERDDDGEIYEKVEENG